MTWTLRGRSCVGTMPKPNEENVSDENEDAGVRAAENEDAGVRAAHMGRRSYQQFTIGCHPDRSPPWRTQWRDLRFGLSFHHACVGPSYDRMRRASCRKFYFADFRA